jgi:hypothetical protein
VRPREGLLMLAVACATLGCRDRQQVGSSSTAAAISSDWISDTALSLRAIALADTVQSAGSAMVVVLLHNGGSPVEVRNDPSYYSLDVRDPDGRELTPDVRDYEAPSLGARASLVLPRNGMLGQVFGLSCAGPPFDPMRVAGRCMWMYPITKAGLYLITAHYRVPQVSVGGKPAPASTDLQSNAVRLYVRQP